MLRTRFVMLVLACFSLILMSLMLPVMAQDNTRPVPITPGVPLYPITPTLSPTECGTPLPIALRSTIYIKPDVNIRAEPNGSSALVWNTMFNNRDEFGEAVDEEDIIAVVALVVGGPVCAGGYNWWQVEIPGNDGWVAEGRLDREGQYLIFIAGAIAPTTCTVFYEMRVGQQAEIARNARIRLEPTTESRTLTVVPAGSTVDLIGEPRCINGIRWWLIRATVADFPYSGWMAEGDGDTYWLMPPNAPMVADGSQCNSPLPFAAGERGTVNSVHNNNPHWLRATPGLRGAPLYLLVENVPFEIVRGPVCRNRLNWWRVRVLASSPVIGWIAEGSTGVGYWLSELDPNEFAK